jgi:hypothetical protein
MRDAGMAPGRVPRKPGREQGRGRQAAAAAWDVSVGCLGGISREAERNAGRRTLRRPINPPAVQGAVPRPGRLRA